MKIWVEFIFCLSLVGIIGLSSKLFAFESVVPIENYQQMLDNFSGSLEIGNLQKRWIENKAPCTVEKQNLDYIISPNCLIRPIDTGLETKDALDTLWPYVQGVNVVYNTLESEFLYEPTQPIVFDKNLLIIDKITINHAFLLHIQKESKGFLVSKAQLAYLMSKNWSWYGVLKSEISSLKPCTKQNYYVAFSSFQDYIWESGSEINVNDQIANLQGYCKGTGPKNLMFYGGVCGFATQLFRLSLLIPNVDVVERYGHSQRYVPYYSDYIFGDDAALYQNNKKLRIKNNLSDTLYLKTLDLENSTYLIAILPRKVASFVEINKIQTDKLKGELTKTVKTKRSSWLAAQFTSFYTQKTYTVR